VKLMASVGSIVGPCQLVWNPVLTSILSRGGLVLVMRKGSLGRTLLNMWQILTSLAHGRAPYQDRPELDVSNERALPAPHGSGNRLRVSELYPCGVPVGSAIIDALFTPFQPHPKTRIGRD